MMKLRLTHSKIWLTRCELSLTHSELSLTHNKQQSFVSTKENQHFIPNSDASLTCTFHSAQSMDKKSFMQSPITR